MLALIRIRPESADFRELDALYVCSFPSNERRPLDELASDATGVREVFGIYDGAEPVGLVCLLNGRNDVSHIIYLTIREDLRDRGYGSRALDAVHALKAGRRIMVDVEREEADVPNPVERARRKRFYLKNSYRTTGIEYRWRGEDYEIMVFGGDLPERDYMDFWRSVGDLGV